MDGSGPDVPSTGTAETEPGALPDSPPVEQPRRYTVEYIGLPDEVLAERLKAVSPLYQNRRKPAETAAQLGRRIREDVNVAERLMRAEGYYAVKVEPRIAWSATADGETAVALLITPGERFVFSRIDVASGSSGPPAAAVRDALTLKQGDPVRAASVLDAESRLRASLPRLGYPFAVVGAHDIVVDHETATASYSLQLDTGNAVTFGALRFSVDGRTRPAHLARLARFKAGEPFSQERIEDLRLALLATGLFAEVAIRIAPGDSDDPLHARIADVDVVAREGRRHSISVAVGYGTGEGPRLDTSWQHRNLFGHEERLTILARAATQEQALRFDLQQANYRKRDQVLSGRLYLTHDDNNAYEAYQATLGALIERRTDQIWQKRWVYALGAELELSKFVAGPKLGTALVASLPASLRYDGSDDLFDPRRGFRLSGAVTPEAVVEKGLHAYVRLDVNAAAYVPFGARVVLAGHARTAMLLGAPLGTIPTNRRLFAGGAGSIRGFGFQDVGPKDGAGNPTGGRSLLELSGEARLRLTDTWGVVGFVDAGNARQSATPSIRGVRWGAGAGIRYFAPFGPIRIDVATPLDRQRGEAVIGVYVSIGQSF